MRNPTRSRIVYLSTVLLIFSFLPQNGWSGSAVSDRTVAQSQHKVRRSPNNPYVYYHLGDAYIQKARESGDPTYFELAEQALRKSLSLNPEQSGARRHLAHVMALRHDFAAAAVEAEKAIAIDPGDVDAHGVMGDAYLEMGRFEQAEKAYKKMIVLKESLASHSRMSGLKSLRGDHEGAVSNLKKAIELGQEQNQPSESIAWAQWQLATDYFSQGNLTEAESYFQKALQTYPNYYRGLAGVAQVRAAERRYDEAIGLYQKAISVIPMPEYIAALGDVYGKIGRADEARKQYELVEYIGKLGNVGDGRDRPLLYNRELAYFYADHDIKLTEALDLAKRELDYRKDIYAYDLLAWNLYKNGKLAEARDAIDEALKLGTKDAKLFYHAGMIHYRLGDQDKAKAFLNRALSTNPHFHILFADTAAQTLMRLERDVEQANAAHEREEG
jgi:tetratricopeptide (TPR) repeat protein